MLVAFFGRHTTTLLAKLYSFLLDVQFRQMHHVLAPFFFHCYCAFAETVTVVILLKYPVELPSPSCRCQSYFVKSESVIFEPLGIIMDYLRVR